MQLRLCQAGTLFFVVIFSAQISAKHVIKKSSSGICHPPESSWYERTKNYIPFDSLKTCLQEGGRLPKGLSLTSLNGAQNENEKNGYDRSAFGHGWDDQDGDCQDSRAEALVATSTTPVRFATNKRCRVVTGRWVSPFTSRVIQNAGDIDIDHVVPLAWSWNRGARQWPREKREQFANDSMNLWPVEAGFSQQECQRA